MHNMSDDQVKFTDVESLVLKGCNVELVVCDDLPGTILVDAAQASKAAEDRASKSVTLTGYEGKVALSMRGHVNIRANDSEVTGTLLDGRITAGGIDVSCEAPEHVIGGVTPSVPPVMVGWALDTVAVLVFTAFYVLIFALLCKVFGGNPVSEAKISWAIVLGAGTYFGYTGHSIAATVMAIAAVLVYMYSRGHQGAEAPTTLSDYVAVVDFIKIGVFLGIMLLGKLLRDYIESYKRAGWAGLKNRMKR